MKYINYLIALAAICVTSCAPTTTDYYQLLYVNSNLEQLDDKYIYQDNNCVVSYDFWANGGNPGFVMQNNTDSIMYVDLGKTFFVRNNYSHCYYKNRIFSQSDASIIGATANTGKTSANGVSIEEKEIVAIAPKSRMRFNEFNIVSDVLQDCSVPLFPKKDARAEISFDSANSPVSFGNYITYKVGDNGKAVSFSNDFYVSKWTNFKKKDVFTTIYDDCKNRHKRTVMKSVNSPCFYVKYNEKHTNLRSADEPSFVPQSSSKESISIFE